MISNKVPMTQGGYQKMQADLSILIKTERPSIIQQISAARALGDLKENAEYHAAKEKQGHIEARISFLEDCLAKAQVIDLSTLPQDGRVIFGVTVTLCNLEDKQLQRYQIVGEYEADVSAHKLSVTSPMVRAMIGKVIDECFEVTTPQGKDHYRIQAIEY
jgi:transcription elongation factor GreA